jgi:hypothetical protein
MKVWVGVATFVVAMSVAIFAVAAEKKIERSALPPAVEKTVQAQSQGATIKGISVEKEKGKNEYEVEMTVNGHGKDIVIGEDGTVLEVEEEVELSAVPDAAQKALTARAKGAKIVKVEAVSKGGKIVQYEAATLKGLKKGEVAAGPNGEKVADED